MNDVTTTAPVDAPFQLLISREDLLPALQTIASVVDKKQTLPILSHLLLRVKNHQLTIIGTDLEIELIKTLPVASDQPEGEITLPARKLYDICKALSEEAVLNFSQQKQQMRITSGRSRFNLSLLPASHYPCVEKMGNNRLALTVSSEALLQLLEKTYFAMAIQDVRYFLNGLLLDMCDGQCVAVATDGHRLAMSQMPLAETLAERTQVLLPRKSVLEMMKLLHQQPEAATITITLGENYVSLTGEGFEFISKLIDSRFPEYRSLVPKQEGTLVSIDKNRLKEGLTRVAILSNEKYRGAWLNFEDNKVLLQTNNPEKDEAEEEVPVNLQGEPLRVGCNISYLLDILAVLEGDSVQFAISGSNASILVLDPAAPEQTYVVMPMCL